MRKICFTSLCLLSAAMIEAKISEREFDVKISSILSHCLRCESIDEYACRSISELIYEYSISVSPEQKANKLNQVTRLREYHCEQALKLIEDLEKIAEKEQERFKKTCFKATIGTLINSLNDRVSIAQSMLTYLSVFAEDIWDTLENHAEFYRKINELKYHIEMYNFYNELIERFDEVCPSRE